MRRGSSTLVFAISLAACQTVCAQNPPEPLSVSAKWRNFIQETASPLTLGAVVFNGGAAHITNSDPRYGSDSRAFASQFGASMADIASQNFLGDFLIASAFHEDPRYFREGPAHGFWSRAAYAMSRAFLIRTDAGRESFNWSNVLGTAMSAGLSNVYYPPASRSGRVTAIHFGLSTAGTGFAKLVPEFWPDFRDTFFKRHKS